MYMIPLKKLSVWPGWRQYIRTPHCTCNPKKSRLKEMFPSGNCNFCVGRCQRRTRILWLWGMFQVDRIYWKTSAGARRNSANIRTSCLKHRSEDAWILDVPCPTMWQETVVPIPPATHRISSACSGYRIIAFPGLLDVPKMAMVSQLWHFSWSCHHVRQWKPMSRFAGAQSSKKKNLKASSHHRRPP